MGVIDDLALAVGANRAAKLAPNELTEIRTDAVGNVTLALADGSEYVAATDAEARDRVGRWATADDIAQMLIPTFKQQGGRLPANTKFMRRVVVIGGKPEVRFTEAGR